MTKPLPNYPPIINWHLRVKLKVFRPTNNTGGRFIVGVVGVGMPTVQYPGISLSTIGGIEGNATINVANLTANAWNDIEIYIQPSGYSWGPFTGAISLVDAYPITGADIYICRFSVDEVGATPGVPQTAPGSGLYYLRVMDNGKHIYIPSGGIQVPSYANVALPIESIVTVINNSGSPQTIAPASGVTIVLAGDGAVGSRTLAAYGQATLLKTDTNEWYISGPGVS